jgi:hypothetical protein
MLYGRRLAIEAGRCPLQVLAMLAGFPSLLGISTRVLAGKWRRLQEYGRLHPPWRQQLGAMPAKSLGRLCACGHAALDRLQFFIERQELQQQREQQGAQPGGMLGPPGGAGRGQRDGWRSAGIPDTGLARLLTLPLQGFKNQYPEYSLWLVGRRGGRG